MSPVPGAKQLEAGKAAPTKDLDRISIASNRNKYGPRRNEDVEFMKIKQQNKINVIYSFQFFLILTTKIMTIYENVWARLREGIFKSMFLFSCTSVQVIFTFTLVLKQN